MKRREFLATGAATAAALTAGGIAKAQNEPPANAPATDGFKLKYAPHPGSFSNSAGNDILDQIQFAADNGFRAWEDNGLPGRDPALQEAIGRKLADNNMEMGVFVSHGGFNTGNFTTNTSDEYQDNLRVKMTEMLDVAARVNAKWTTVVPGNLKQNLEQDYQTANCIENLRVLAEVCETTGLIIVLEPLNWWVQHPGMFLQTIPQAYLICKAVNSPCIKILDDLYHQQVQAGNLINNMEKAWDEIAYIQVGDNPGRKEPYTGEVNYQGVFKYLFDKGYEGLIGMEHGNSVAGVEGERKLIEAYRMADDF